MRLLPTNARLEGRVLIARQQRGVTDLNAHNRSCSVPCALAAVIASLAVPLLRRQSASGGADETQRVNALHDREAARYDLVDRLRSRKAALRGWSSGEPLGDPKAGSRAVFTREVLM